MNKYIPNDIKVISQIEEEYDVINLFQYKNTTCWVAIKELLTTSMYHKDIRLHTGNKKDVFSTNGIKTIIYSLKNYFQYYRSKEKKSIYLGASTGLFSFENKILDSYFPYYDLDIKESIYMLNCGNLNELIEHKRYLEDNNTVIENYIIGIPKKILAKIIKLTISKSKKIEILTFVEYLRTKNLEVSYSQILVKYSEFIAGYKLYKSFFKFLNIDKVYIVSASSKSDMLASLKHFNVNIIEIQHGIVGQMHRGYNYNLSQNSYLPVPNRINVYNQFWKDEIVKAGYFKAHDIEIVGRLKYDIVKSNIKELNYKYIIFTGQGAFFDKIIKFFKESDTYLKAKNIQLIYKPHPRELKSEIENFKKEISNLASCSIYDGEYTTEELIKHSLAHVSVFSSCHFDAVYYKEQTFVLNIMSNNIMQFYSQNSKNFIEISNITEVLNEIVI